jgi:hypothetical protein
MMLDVAEPGTVLLWERACSAPRPADFADPLSQHGSSKAGFRISIKVFQGQKEKAVPRLA